MMIKQHIVIIIALLIISPLHAEDDSVVPYLEAGLIDRVGEDNKIVIDDTLYDIVPYAKIHANSKYPGVYVVESLAPGMNAGIKLEPVGNKSKVITELWLLD